MKAMKTANLPAEASASFWKVGARARKASVLSGVKTRGPLPLYQPLFSLIWMWQGHLQEHVSLLVDPVFEFSHNAEVRTSSSNRPEEVRIRFFGSFEDSAIGKDDSCCEEVVDDEAVLAGKESGAAS